MKSFVRGLALVIGLVGALCAQAQAPALGPPLHVGTTNGLVNEFGQPLRGVTPAAAAFGHSVVAGEIVQILLVTNSVFPPDASGNPDPQNALLFSGRVGDGMDPGAGATAMFGFSVPKRPAGGQVVARVFNQDSLAASSFYADSQVFAVDPSFNYAFIPQMTQTLQPVDTGDNDGDGLINSWEKSLGSDAGNPDSDGDGVGDVQEWRAGTGLLDAQSLLAMVQLSPVSADLMNVTWDSVTAKVYQVEFRPGDLGNSTNAYQAVSSVITAQSFSTSITVTNDISPIGHYRVRLVEP